MGVLMADTPLPSRWKNLGVPLGVPVERGDWMEEG